MLTEPKIITSYEISNVAVLSSTIA